MTSRHADARTLAKPAEEPSPSRFAVSQFANELIEAGLDSIDVLLDYQLPHSGSEADLVLCGLSPATGALSYLVVEIKLWTGYDVSAVTPDLVTRAGREGPQLNPVVQAEQYARYLADHLSSPEEDPITVAGIAYLPNGTFGRGEQEHLFTGADRGALHEFLRSHLVADHTGRAVDRLALSQRTTADRLMSSVADEIGQRSRLILLDEQQVAESLVKRAVRRAVDSGRKEIVIVTGGPGTGKSALGISLLGDLHRAGRSVRHATASKPFTTSLRKAVGSRIPGTRGLFTYFNSLATAAPDELDVLICDEAQRIRASSANRFTPRAARTGLSQIEELIRAARVTVFLIDHQQVVDPGEVGTAELVESVAGPRGWAVQRVHLDGRFRTSGSERYGEWTQCLLGLDENWLGPLPWLGDGQFTLATASEPQELEDRLTAAAQQGHLARMLAGVCWPMSQAEPHKPLPLDVVIGDWARPWAVAGDRGVGGAPPGTQWAVDPAGFSQIGHAHVAKGFEFDWAGVIFGPDLVWRGDRWAANRAAVRNPALRKASDDILEGHLRRTYYVLLSRARRGAILHSTDQETQDKLQSLVPADGQ